MSNNYFKYYHLRTPSVGKVEQPPAQQVLPLQLSAGKQSADSSPWRSIQNTAAVSSIHPLNPVVQTSQQVGTQYFQSNVQIHQPNQQLIQQQQYSLEKQNECLKREKNELERQIESLKIYYTKQTTLDQQELMRYEREKASLADKLREMDSLLTGVKEKYEKEAAEEKFLCKKQRQESESKLEKATTYYADQLSLKQEELHKARGKLQLTEITVADLQAKLKIQEQTNKDLRTKWDEDIKGFGSELESLNKQLIKERYRNDELERLSKLNKISGRETGLERRSDSKSSEVEQLKTIQIEQRAKISDLEKRLKEKEIIKQTEKVNDKIGGDYQKYISDITKLNKTIEALERESIGLQSKLNRSEKLNAEKDVLVQKMVQHIEQIEKENAEQLHQTTFSLIEDRLNQLQSENQGQKQELEFFANEIERITTRNRLLEEQLYLPETQRQSILSNQLLEKRLDSIEMKCNQLKLQLSQSQFNQPSNKTEFNQLQEIYQEVEEAKRDILAQQQSKSNQLQIKPPQQTQQITSSYNSNKNYSCTQGISSSRESQLTGDFSPVHQLENEKSGLQSEYKMVTVPDRLIRLNEFQKEGNQEQSIQQQQQQLQEASKNQQNHSNAANDTLKDQDADNASQQTFGDAGKDATEQTELLEQMQFLIDKSKEEKQQEDAAIAFNLLQGGDDEEDDHNPFISQAIDYVNPPQKEDLFLKPIRIDEKAIELDLTTLLTQKPSYNRQFEKSLEDKEIFDLFIAFIGASQSGKSTVINSIKKGEWDQSVKVVSCQKKILQISRQSFMANRQVGMLEASMIQDIDFMNFICNFSQAIALFFKSWEATDQKILGDYIKLLQSESNFASECIVIHSESEKLSEQQIDKFSKDFIKLQDNLYRSKIEGKSKKINIYHILLPTSLEKEKSHSIFEETIAVCRGTIIGKLASSKEKYDLFKKLNKYLY